MEFSVIKRNEFSLIDSTQCLIQFNHFPLSDRNRSAFLRSDILRNIPAPAVQIVYAQTTFLTFPLGINHTPFNLHCGSSTGARQDGRKHYT